MLHSIEFLMVLFPTMRQELLLTMGAIIIIYQMFMLGRTIGSSLLLLKQEGYYDLGAVEKALLLFKRGDDDQKLGNLRKDVQKWNNILPKPKGWEEFKFGEIRAYFGCHEYAGDRTKPLLTLKDWEYLRSKYIEIVDKHAVFDDPVPPTDGYSFDENGPPPYYASHGVRGRGLFASRDIKKGEIIHDGERSDIEFSGGETWRKFIFSLPRNRACDVIDWSWTQKKSGDGKNRLLSAMDISILLNGDKDNRQQHKCDAYVKHIQSVLCFT